MSKLKVSFKKLSELEYECYQNALRLHSDSILLYSRGSFASAFALSILANEEFGKGFAIAEICYQAKFENKLGAHDEEFLRALLSDHKLKQSWFRHHAFGGIFTPKRLVRHFDRIQLEKNNAFYVGVRKGNHHIIRFFLLTKSKARKQIRLTNNALITMVEGALSGEHYYEEVYSTTCFETAASSRRYGTAPRL